MEYISSVFSLLFFLGALISLYWGFYIIRLNVKSTINRIFLLLCLALSIWSFGFAMANSQSSLSDALFWRRFSAIGWTSIFSILLHFLLLISKHKDHSKLNKYLFFLYLPAAINMYIFAFSNSMAKIQYSLVKIDYGWTNIAVNNGWDYFYYLYYSIYMILSTLIVWKWGGKLKEEIKIRQAKLIFVAMFSAAIPGALIDLAANTFLINPLPQMAPLFILFPIWAMYHSARYHDVLNIKKIKKEETIISNQQQKKYLSVFQLEFVLVVFLPLLLNIFHMIQLAVAI